MNSLENICKIVFGIVITVLISISESSQTGPGRWENPCVGSAATPIDGSIFGNLFQHMINNPEPLVGTLNRTLRNTRECYSLAEHLKERLFNESIQNEMYRRFLDAYHFEGFPSLEVVPRDEILANITRTNIVNFDKLAMAAVFIEQSREQEVESVDPIFKNDILNNEKKLYTVMCNLEKAIENGDGTINGGVSRDIMSDDLRNPGNTAGRHERDYIIYKDFHMLLKNLIDEFTIIINHLSS